MNIIFMGTPDLAATVFDKLIASNHNILAAVTQPDRPVGRGKKIKYSPVKELALEHNIPVLQPNKARDEEFISELESYNPDIIVVAAYGQILPEGIINLPKFGCINVHTSLLPKYRGASPIQWAIMNGDEKTGVTIMHMDTTLDTGDIIIQEEVIIDKKETAASLHDKLALCGGDLVIEAIKLMEEGKAPRIKQDDSMATYVKTIDKSEGKIDFSDSSIVIERKIRGLNPWPSAYTFLNGQNLKVWDAEVLEEEIKDSLKNKQASPGQIVDVSDNGLIVNTGHGYLNLLEIQLAGKKRMKVADFLRGNKVEVGTVLGIEQV
ncbi:MAG: methionyl-tRNA formyltransferase [Clostridiales bacterium]|nr:methionyl-tRNA formyltransferase [Clostridiales bacterium]